MAPLNPKKRYLIIRQLRDTKETLKSLYQQREGLDKNSQPSWERGLYTHKDQKAVFVTIGHHRLVIWRRAVKHWVTDGNHNNMHTGNITGLCGLLYRDIVLEHISLLLGFINLYQCHIFIIAETFDFQWILEKKEEFSNSSLLSFSVHDIQLRLVDNRIKREYEGDPSQSGFVRPLWLPDGLLLSSGLKDLKIHLFNIRYSLENPVKIIHVHYKYVYKAVFH
ncbi:hypothetical protein CTI12_AA419290 [Artemisia annua]|uniref:Uncharacterized protein n=1 Tax=Artemisia annua TaxID=35608 RepID=A0A2U1M513_ARTAN|nr:hypothetical protein CTI12_AA419290 [Artemisia annua]